MTGAFAAFVLSVGLVTASGLQVPDRGSPGPADLRLAASDGDPATPMTDTRFRMATFNVLGAGHTVNSTRFEDGVTRMRYTVRLMRENRLSVVGMQELRRVQYDELKRLTGDTYAAWPGERYAEAAMQNSIVWNRNIWAGVRRETVPIPYFNGNMIRMPYVLLKHRATGQQVWFSNFHNPANAHGDAERWRDQATNIETDLVRRLRSESPTTPVFLMGDFNEREEIFQKVLSRTDLYAANGGGRRPDGTWEYPPRPRLVDWIFGSRDIAMTGYRNLRSPLVQKASDHPLVMTDVSVPPLSMETSPIDRVLVVSVAGLRSRAFSALSAAQIPALTNLRTRGASTLNARTTRERTLQLPNVASMLTGRPVARRAGGHAVASERDPGTTVHARAGRYVSSIFDVAHNFGRSTALYSQRPNSALFDRSWNAANGGTDPYQLDDGRDKIDRFVVNERGGRLTDAVVGQIERRPADLMFVELTWPDLAGHRHGFGSDAYFTAVRRTDRLVRRIHGAIARNPRTRGRTLVVVMGSHAGAGSDHADPDRFANAQVPLLVFGPGVERGGDLHALNPHYLRPRRSLPDHSGPQPIRTSSVANLALMGLRLPSVPGSRFNVRQDLNPFAGQ